MDMNIFQIEPSQQLPRIGSLLIASPFLYDFYFTRSVVLVAEHNEEGSMGILVNKSFNRLMNLDDVVPELSVLPPIPLYKGGPVGRDTLFYLHNLDFLKHALPVGNGLYLNGDFEQLKRYLLTGGPISGHIRFFMGYTGWTKDQLMQEIEEKSWIVSNGNSTDLLHMYLRDLWQESLHNMGGKYAVWSRYPQHPFMN
jgi:putative transcriptional regulator